MPDAFAAADGLGLYMTGVETDASVYSPDTSLGGVRLVHAVAPLRWYVEVARYGNVVVQAVSGACGEGTAYIRATATGSLAFTAPGDTEGSAVAIANGETKLLTSGGSASKWVRVTRTSATAFPVDSYSTGMVLSLVKPYSNLLGMPNVSHADRAAGLSNYRAAMLWAHGGLDVTSVAVWIRTLGTQRTSDGTQLSGAGSGTITTTGSLADWPTAGYCRVSNSGGTLKEIVYYTSRTATSLTVPAAGRGLLGTSATAGANTDLIDAVPGIRIGWEAPATADYTIQAVATSTTAPSGITWSTGITSATGLTLATLSAWQSYGLWIHRQIPAGATASHRIENAINLSYVVAGVTYTSTISGLYAMADTALALYRLYAGEDASPTFASPVATSATLPLTHALAAPGAGTRDYRLVCRYRNAYGLESFNLFERSIKINAAGAQVNSPLSEPDGVTLTAKSGGYVDLDATYYGSRDDTPGDTWRVYATTTGADPVVGVTSYTDYPMRNSGNGVGVSTVRSMWGGQTYVLSRRLGPYAWGTDLRVLVRAVRSSDSAVSSNTTATQLTVVTDSPAPVAWPEMFAGDEAGVQQTGAYVDTTTTIHAGSNTRIRQLPGESQFLCGSTLIWRATWTESTRGILYVPNGWALVEDDTAWGAGAGDIEYVAGPPVVIYLNVGGTRRAKIDVTNLTISAAEFGLGDVALTDCVSDGAYAATGTQLLFQVWDGILGRWRACVALSSAGRLSTMPAVWQRRS